MKSELWINKEVKKHLEIIEFYSEQCGFKSQVVLRVKGKWDISFDLDSYDMRGEAIELMDKEVEFWDQFIENPELLTEKKNES